MNSCPAKLALSKGGLRDHSSLVLYFLVMGWVTRQTENAASLISIVRNADDIPRDPGDCHIDAPLDVPAPSHPPSAVEEAVPSETTKRLWYVIAVAAIGALTLVRASESINAHKLTWLDSPRPGRQFDRS